MPKNRWRSARRGGLLRKWWFTDSRTPAGRSRAPGLIAEGRPEIRHQQRGRNPLPNVKEAKPSVLGDIEERIVPADSRRDRPANDGAQQWRLRETASAEHWRRFQFALTAARTNCFCTAAPDGHCPRFLDEITGAAAHCPTARSKLLQAVIPCRGCIAVGLRLDRRSMPSLPEVVSRVVEVGEMGRRTRCGRP